MKAKNSGLILALGALQFLLAVQITSGLYPGYSPWANYISDLGNAAKAGPAIAAAFNASAVLLGLAVVISAPGIGGITARRAAATSLLALAGLGAVGVGPLPRGLALRPTRDFSAHSLPIRRLGPRGPRRVHTSAQVA